MNTPDTNSSGRMITLTIGSDASALGMAEEAAKPRAQNAAAPTASMASIRSRVARWGCPRCRTRARIRR
jgi:hypothetical protein